MRGRPRRRPRRHDLPTLQEMMAICMADGQMLKRPSRALCHAATPIGCHQCFPALRPEFMTLRAERLKAVLADVDRFVFPSEFLADATWNWGLPGPAAPSSPTARSIPRRGSTGASTTRP